ncbi:hypothetical protein [Nocardia nova]|uniref:hypothetical protein n=1 Tax=Nocardia nova TaxID=37330 RepID=UPI003405BFE8
MSWETNVLVPASALSALDVVRIRRGYRSRDKTVVALLESYVQDQQRRAVDERLTHISTVIRYPPAPRDTALRGVEPGVRLRLRLDRALWASACALAFTLPGQSLRGPSDYQARRGADAVLTALACAEPLEDPVVGEHQLLTHRQALRLWQLVVEATRTRAERDITEAADAVVEAREIAAMRGRPWPESDTEVELIARCLEQDVSWHGRMRYRVAAALVADRLHGPGASAFLTLLSHEDIEEDVWLDEIDWCRKVFVNNDPSVRSYMGVQGRGAVTVWRAARAVRLDAMLAWIAASGSVWRPRTLTLDPPGWRLQLPKAWVPAVLPAAPDTGEWGNHIAAGRVLLIEHNGARVVWPTRVLVDGTAEPVPGFDAVTGEIGAADIRRVAEVVLISTIVDDTYPGPRLRVPVPAHVACDLGLISTDSRDRKVAAARRNISDSTCYRDIRDRSGSSWRVMDHDLLFADLEQRYRDPDDREQARMAYARGVGPFVRYLRSIGHPAVSAASFAWDSGTQFVWPVHSLATLLESGRAEEPLLKWLAAWRRDQHRRVLYADTSERWITAVRYAEEEDIV